MIPAILMIAGAAIWLVGELYAVFTGHSDTETTSAWVWLAERKWPFLRIVIALALLLLIGHFEWNMP